MKVQAKVFFNLIQTNPSMTVDTYKQTLHKFRIGLIKEIRSVLGIGLKESKDLVEALIEAEGLLEMVLTAEQFTLFYTMGCRVLCYDEDKAEFGVGFCNVTNYKIPRVYDISGCASYD